MVTIWGDGEEDKNKNGRWDKELNETDPTFADRDNDGIEDKADDDIDGDGMTNEFERLYPKILDPYDPTDAKEDPDNDDYTNYQEFLGDDKKPGNKDWSNPNDPGSTPDEPPKVEFLENKLEHEAQQTLEINSTSKYGLVFVDDSQDDWDYGLKFSWDWGDGVIDKQTYNDKKIKSVHSYDKAGKYVLTLTVTDQYGNSNSDTMEMDISPPIGETGTIYDVKREEEAFNAKKTVRRYGWIGYKLVGVEAGEKITIEYEVTDKNLGLRIFIIPAKNINVYRENNPISGKPISHDYEEYWEGHAGTELAKKGKIEFTAEKNEDIIILFDNNYYDTYKKNVDFDDPVEFKVKITREESPVFMILLIVIIVIVIISVIIAAVFYKKLRESKGMTKITREAAIETQRSLDREMAQLELEIQDSLRRGPAMRGAPMPARAMPQHQMPPRQPPAPAGAPPTRAAPGTVPQAPRPATAQAGVRPTTATPGATPGTMARGPAPASGSAGGGQQQMLPPAAQVPQAGQKPMQQTQ